MGGADAFGELVAAGDLALDRLDACAAAHPDKVFIHYGDGDVRLSFAEVRAQADAFAAALVRAGVRPGDHVSVLTRSSLATALAMFAIWRAGAVFAPVNFNLKGELLRYQLADTAPAVLVTDAGFAEVLAPIAAALPIARIVALDGVHAGAEGGAEVLAAALAPLEVVALAALLAEGGAVPRVPRAPCDAASIIYTSGTTGPAKGVVQSFRWINQYTFLLRTMGAPDDVIYCDLPLYHVGGVFGLFTRALWHGNTVGLWDRFSPNAFWDRVMAVGATTTILVDVMIQWLLTSPPRPTDAANPLNKIHMQPLSAAHHEFATRFGIDFVTSGFGQTEAGTGFLALVDELGDAEGVPAPLRRGLPKAAIRAAAARWGVPVRAGNAALPKGFMGAPSPFYEVAVLDGDDLPVPAGTAGELAFRPRYPGILADGYLGKAEATVRTWRNLWFHTGDSAVLNDDGTASFVDRIGGFFRVRGENVSSFEVESTLNAHPRIRACAAVPVPAAEGEEEDIALFVELVEDAAMDAGELLAFARDALPRYMVPRHVRFLPALPLTPTNKVEKFKLKRALLDELAAGAAA